MNLHIVVLMGGFSREREISLRSGAAVVRGLRQAGFQVEEVDITGPDFVLPRDTDAAFIALHGEFGEDGGIQARLEALGVPYTGTGPAASRVAFDKALTKQCLVQQGIMTPVYEVLGLNDSLSLPLPVIVKPLRQGSSLGVHCVRHESDWSAAFEEALSYDGAALVEEYIPGRELTVGLVGEQVLPVVEIVAPDNNYDYRAKYTPGITRYLVPAPLPEDVAHLCRAISERAFRALAGRGFGRVDLRLHPDGRLFVLEMNTIPGFTETSLLPKAAAAAGISFPELCSRILRLAIPVDCAEGFCRDRQSCG